MKQRVSGRAAVRAGMALSASVLALGATALQAQTAPPPCPNGTPGPRCEIDNDGTIGPITGNPGNVLIITNSGTISGAPAINVGNAVILNLVNTPDGVITGTGGSAIQLGARTGVPLLNFGIVNQGTIDGNVSFVEPTPAPSPAPGLPAGLYFYISDGGTLNGNLQLGTGFSSAYFLQRGADDGVTGTVSAGGGIDVYARSYAGTQSVALGASLLPATFEIEGFEAFGADSVLTLTGSGTSINLAGTGNIVNEADIATLDTSGLFPPGVTVIPAAISNFQPRLASFPRPNPAPGTPNIYVVGYGEALNSFTNNGIVDGDIRLATASFVNTNAINQISSASGSVITGAANRDFLFQNSGTIAMAFTGPRAAGTNLEVEVQGQEAVNAAVRVRSALDTTDPGDAGIVNTGDILGGLDVSVAADNLLFENSGILEAIDEDDYFVRAVTVRLGELDRAVGVEPVTEFNADSATIRNLAGGDVRGGFRVEAAANTLVFENQGAISWANADRGVALFIDQDLLEPGDDDGADALSLSFTNSGAIDGGVNFDIETSEVEIVNSGDIVRTELPIDQADPPLFGGVAAVDIGSNTLGSQSVVLTNSGTIASQDRGGSGLLLEVEAGDDDNPEPPANADIHIVNSGDILASGGATVTPGVLINQPGTVYINQVAALGVDAEATGTTTVVIENLAGGLIEASGAISIITPTGPDVAYQGSAGSPPASHMVAVGVAANNITIINSGTISGGAGTDYSGNTPIIDNALGQPNSYLAGAIHTSGDQLEDNSGFLPSTDRVVNTATGVIIGSIDLNAGDDTIENAGSIAGDVFLRDGDDVFVNSGALTGAVAMGAGNDRFVQFLSTASLFNATVDGGEGDDILAFDITGSDGQFTQAFRDLFISFEQFSLVGTANVTIVADGDVTIDEDTEITVAPGENAIEGSDEGQAIANAGTVNGNVALGGGDNSFANTGAVTGDIVTGDGDNNVTNGGTVTGDVAFGDGANSLENEGTITGEVTFGDGDNSIQNSGTITGNVSSGDGDDSFVNTGTVDGDVDLGGGSDSYAFGDGVVTGTVHAGEDDGTDQIVYNAPGGQTPLGARGIRAAAIQPDEIEVNEANTANLQGFEQFVVNGPANIYAGGNLGFDAFVLNGASLRVGAGASLDTAGDIAIFGSAGSETVTNGGSISGAIDLAGGDDTLILQSGATFDSGVDGGAGTDTLRLATASTVESPTEVDGARFIGFEQLANMSGVNRVTGTLAVEALNVLGGRLIGAAGSTINGDITVSGTGTFGSAGTINGDVTLTGGTLSPGASPGIMTINGNLTIGNGTTTIFEFVPVGQSDLILVNGGSVSIGSSTTLNLTGSLTPGDTRDLIVVTGGTITGDFTTVNRDPGIVGVVRRNADNTALQLLGVFVAPDTATPQVEAGIDYVNELLVEGSTSSALLAAFPNLLSGGVANAAAFAQINPEAYASASQLGVEQGLSLARAGRGGLIGPHPQAAGAFLFAQGLGDWRRLQGDRNIGTSRASNQSYGLIGGIGLSGETGSIGAFVGYVDSRQTIGTLGTRTEADGLVAGLTGRLAAGGFSLSATLAYDWSDARTRRPVPGGTVIGSAAYRLRSWVLDAVVGYSLPVGRGWSITPEIGITHVSTKRGATVEDGSPAFALAIDADRTNATFVDGVVHFEGDRASTFRPWIQFGVRQQLSGEVSDATAGFVGNATQFTVLGANREETLATLGLGASIALSPGASLYGAYQGEYGGGRSHNVSVGVRFGF